MIVFEQTGRLILQSNMTSLQHVSILGNAQGLIGVLLYQ